MTRVLIIGGGIAGCMTAIELAKKNYEVILLEQKGDILKGTSGNTPGRMGLGYHYFDSNTAKRYMKHTIEFMKKYPDCFIGDNTTPHLGSGRYFVVKDSLVDPEEVMSQYNKISSEFQRMCEEDRTNNIFKATHLHRVLSTFEFEDDVDCNKVAIAIETQERLLDWPKFTQTIKAELEKYKNIAVRTSADIDSIEFDETGRIKVISKSGTGKKIDREKFDCVVNCTWQNIEKITSSLRIGDSHCKKENPKEAMNYRLKLLAEVQLPDGLKNKPSMFFCFGQHCMFSNLGNGIGRITFAPVTNFGTTTESEMPDQFRRWLEEGLSDEEIAKYGKQIIDGVARYIPAMQDAELLNVMAGIVKSIGTVALDDKNSPVHIRDYSGVKEVQIGWIDNAAMKLFYCLGNAQEVVELVENQELAKEELIRILDFDDFKGEREELPLHNRIIVSATYSHLKRNSTYKDIEKIKEAVEQMKHKGVVLTEIKELTDGGVPSSSPSSTQSLQRGTSDGHGRLSG